MRIREEGVEDLQLDLTALIDVVFQLLIFFMLATTFGVHEREMNLELPKAETGSSVEAEPEELVLNVLDDGRVFFRNADLDDAALLALLRGTAQRDPETPVTIRGHRLARHEMIVRIMDACGLAGLSNLAIGTTREGEG